MEIVKIKTKKGRIITLSVLKITSSHIFGDDKFNCPVILPFDDIESMLPIEKERKCNN